MARMTAAQAAVSILKAEGATHLFGLPGAAINPFYKAMALDGGLRHTLARLDGLEMTPDIRSARERAAVWRPYRSYAAAYLWSWPAPN